MVRAGRDLWRSSGPTALLKQGHLGQVAQDHAEVTFTNLQRERLHNFSGQPVPEFCHLHGKEVLPDV